MMARLWQYRGMVYPLLLVLVLLQPFFADIDSERFHGDESRWRHYSALYFSTFVLSRDFDSPAWSRWQAHDQPQIGKYLIGACLWLSGGEAAVQAAIDAPRYRFSQSREWNESEGRVPTADELRPGRLMMAGFGLAACLLVYVIGWWVGGAEVGLIGALLLGLNPTMQRCSRRLMTDAPLMFFMLLVVVLLPVLLSAYRRGKRGRVFWACVAMGVGLACAAGIKLGGLLMVVVFAAWMCLLAVEIAVHRSRAPMAKNLLHLCAMGLTTALVSAALFTAVSPHLYGNPLRGAAKMLDHRIRVAGNQQNGMPEAALRTPGDKVAKVYQRLFDPAENYSRFSRKLHVPLELFFFVVGLVGLLSREVRSFRRRREFSKNAFILVWVAGIFFCVGLAIPLDWERYFLPLLPPLVVVTACGLGFSLGWVSRWVKRTWQSSPAEG